MAAIFYGNRQVTADDKGVAVAWVLAAVALGTFIGVTLVLGW